MVANFTDRAGRILDLAQREARRYRHSYVGTEHVLLGLVGESTGELIGVLEAFGADPARIRQEIETLIAPGPAEIAESELPLTPRAKTTIEIAAEEARDANQKQVDAAHLLLGLLREPEGVAGKVLVGLGLNLIEVRESVLKIRRQQMRLVERAVRPVRASNVHKRKIREELLAHLTGIYDEELARSGNVLAALRAAAERFGDPAELAAELNAALPFNERITYFINRSAGWRPPESIAHYMLRFAVGVTVFVAIFHCVLILLVTLKDGWNTSLILAKPILGATPFMFVDTFVLGLLYCQLRDAMCGAPWAPRSMPRAIAFGGLIAAVTFGSALAFNLLAGLDQTHAARALYITLGVAATAAAVFPIVARVHGPEQISDAIWAGLDLDSAPLVLS